MKKLDRNSKPGSLRDKFEGVTIAPSLRTWHALERNLAAHNSAVKRKRRRAAAHWFISAAAILIIGIVLFPSFVERTYHPRHFGPGTLSAVNSDLGFEALSLEQTRPADQFVDTDLIENHDAPVAPIDTETSDTISPEVLLVAQNNDPSSGHISDNTAPELDLKYLNVKPHDFNLNAGLVAVSLLYSPLPNSKGNEPRWLITARAGGDFTTRSTQVKSLKNNFSQAGAISYNYRRSNHSTPSVFTFGVERKLTRHTSITAGFSRRSLRSVRESDVYKNNYAVKELSSSHNGLFVGVKFSLFDHPQLEPFVEMNISAERVSPIKSVLTEYQGEEIIASTVEEHEVGANFATAAGGIGLNMHLTRKLTMQGVFNLTRPIFNYSSELNVYNTDKPALPGIRLGLSYAL